MKILKILLILLVPALGFVSCQKSNVKPDCNNSKTEATVNNNNSKINSTSGQDELDPISTDIIGSGDDDRDGGDKKKKAKAQ